LNGRKNDFIKGLIANGWKERTTDRLVIIFGNNLLIFFPS
jgi:hypothetical protein